MKLNFSIISCLDQQHAPVVPSPSSSSEHTRTHTHITVRSRPAKLDGLVRGQPSLKHSVISTCWLARPQTPRCHPDRQQDLRIRRCHGNFSQTDPKEGVCQSGVIRGSPEFQTARPAWLHSLRGSQSITGCDRCKETSDTQTSPLFILTMYCKFKSGDIQNTYNLYPRLLLLHLRLTRI